MVKWGNRARRVHHKIVSLSYQSLIVQILYLQTLEAISPKKVLPGLLEKYNGQPVQVIATGKAAIDMACALVKAGADIKHALVITKKGHVSSEQQSVLAFPYIKILEATHPIPDAHSEKAGRELLQFARSLDPAIPIVYLLSGGTSALTAVPADGLALQQIRDVTEALLKSGATILEVNTVRKHITQVSGGQLREAFPEGAVLHTVVISDILDNDMSVLGSGPCVPDPTTIQDALAVLERYKIEAPKMHKETPKKSYDKDTVDIAISNLHAAEAFKNGADKAGIPSEISPEIITGDAQETGRKIAQEVRARLQKSTDPIMLIYRGEPVVTIDKACTGSGSRSMEVVLSALLELHDIPGVTIAGFETDGTAANTDAAGAIGESGLIDQASGRSALLAHDTYPFFKKTGCLITTGPTGNNVCDIYIAHIHQK
ncbi:MAG: DUF4147 domain-containing protein [Candidatus Margulisbacteria bacterium]|nr:DUF4147 domain-containing protein [Candidatus Margulisiibacteriota bacterium]